QPQAAHVLAYEASGMWSPIDWSPAGDRLLVQHEISETRAEPFVLEPGKSLGTQIDPAAKPRIDVAFRGAAFAPGGKGVYYLSEAGGEFRGLWYRDLASGKDRALTPDAQADYDELVASPDRQRLALTVNEAGWSRVRLYDVRRQRFAADPELPRT